GDAGVLETRGQTLIASDADERAWTAWRRRLPKHVEEPWFRVLELERARWRGERDHAERVLDDLVESNKADAGWARTTRAGIALSFGDLATADKLLDQELHAQHPGPLGVHVALLLGIAHEWTGDRKTALAWYERAQEVATSWDDHELCRYLLA